MKILVSSKSLAAELNSIDLSETPILRAELQVIKRDEPAQCWLLLHHKTGYIKLAVHVLVHTTDLNQGSRRWDWIRDLLNKVDEQPVVLDIYSTVVNVTFQY